jgi:hypothetical protein
MDTRLAGNEPVVEPGDQATFILSPSFSSIGKTLKRKLPA